MSNTLSPLKLTMKILVSHMMLCMRAAEFSVHVHYIEVQMIHAVIHVDKKQEDSNYDTHLHGKHLNY